MAKHKRKLCRRAKRGVPLYNGVVSKDAQTLYVQEVLDGEERIFRETKSLALEVPINDSFRPTQDEIGQHEFITEYFVGTLSVVIKVQTTPKNIRFLQRWLNRIGCRYSVAFGHGERLNERGAPSPMEYNEQKGKLWNLLVGKCAENKFAWIVLNGLHDEQFRELLIADCILWHGYSKNTVPTNGGIKYRQVPIVKRKKKPFESSGRSLDNGQDEYIEYWEGNGFMMFEGRLPSANSGAKCQMCGNGTFNRTHNQPH